MKHKARFETRLSKHGTTVYVNGSTERKAFVRALDSSTMYTYIDPGDWTFFIEPAYVLYMSADVSLSPGTDSITYDGTSYGVQQAAMIYLAETAIAQIVIIANRDG
jgi:hypothetical protein